MTSSPTEAMVLAAGKGTRMRPLTNDTPKPLIKVAGRALIDYALDRFAAAGVEKAVVNVHYLADQIEHHLSDRRAPQIEISDERDALLETGGGLKRALPKFSEDALFCTNTDAIILDATGENACASLAAHWRPDEMDALLLLVPIERSAGYDGRGDFDQDGDGRLSFREYKTAPYVFTGLQIISRQLIETGPDGPFSTKLLWDNAHQKRRLFGVLMDGEWLHVGDPKGLKEAEQKLIPYTDVKSE